MLTPVLRSETIANDWLDLVALAGEMTKGTFQKEPWNLMDDF